MKKHFKYSDINADLYMGNGIGRHLLNSINSARSNIFIISPFISPEFVDILVRKALLGVRVLLLTNDMHTQQNDVTGHKDIIYKTLIQNQHIDEDALKKRKTNKKIGIAWIIFNILLLGLMLFMQFEIVFTAPFFILKHRHFWIYIFLLLSCICSFIYYKKSRKICYLTYSYSPLLNFKIFKNGYIPEDYIHAKVYCVDKEVYVGSLNFTENGFFNYFETMVNVKDENTVRKITKNIMNLYNDSSRDFYSMEELRYYYFQEPLF